MPHSTQLNNPSSVKSQKTRAFLHPNSKMSTVCWIFVALLVICHYHDAASNQNDASDENAASNEGGVNCMINEFECADGQKCIPRHWRCDVESEGSSVCSDLSHKADCSANRCLKSEHRCGNGYCIPTSLVCDGIGDCYDRSDEWDCAPVTDAICLRNQFRCNSGRCIPIHKRCDGVNGGCHDNSDESGCPRKSWCPEGYRPCRVAMSDDTMQCMPESRFCDGHQDCQDNSDEQNCTTCEKWGCSHFCDESTGWPQCSCEEGYELDVEDKRTCRKISNSLHCLRNQFECVDGKKCVPIRLRCATYFGVPEGCDDQSHKALCDSHKCLEGEHKCRNGRCIPSSWVCDGHGDCSDDFDEAICDTITDSLCKKNEFRCLNGTCIRILNRCNGNVKDGCIDRSDETDCPVGWCPEGYLPCAKPTEDGTANCIPKSHFCDGQKDCGDNSDEKDCLTCEKWGCSHFCDESTGWPQCLCKGGYFLDLKDKRTCRKIGDGK